MKNIYVYWLLIYVFTINYNFQVIQTICSTKTMFNLITTTC